MFIKDYRIGRGLSEVTFQDWCGYDELKDNLRLSESDFEAIKSNSERLAEQIETIEIVPNDLYSPKISVAEAEVRQRAEAKLKAVYGENPDKAIIARVNSEIKAVLNKGYGEICWSAMKICDYAKSKGEIVGSRGSVGSSFLAWLCDITEVNSLPSHYMSITHHLESNDFKWELVKALID